MSVPCCHHKLAMWMREQKMFHVSCIFATLFLGCLLNLYCIIKHMFNDVLVSNFVKYKCKRENNAHSAT